MNDSCLDNVNVSVPEIDVVKEVSVDTAMDVLEKEVSGSTSTGVNAVVSRNKRKRPKRNSAKCGVNSIAQDNVDVSIPETDVIDRVPSNLTTSVLENEVLGGVNNVVSKKSKRKRKKEALAEVNSDMGVLEKDVSVSAGVISTMGVLEKEALAEVNGNIGVLEKDVSAVVNDVVPKKSRRKRKKEALAGVNSDLGVLEKEVSVSAGVISTMGVLEKEALAEVNGNIGALEKDVSAVVNDVVPKKSRRKRKKEALAGVNSAMGVLEKEALAEVNGNIGVLEKDVSAVVNDVVSDKRKRKCKRLDNVSVGNPKTDVEEVPVQSNLTSSLEKFHIPPIDTTMGVLQKEVSGGVSVVVSKKKKRKPKRSTMEMTCLDNVSVGIPKTDVQEEVPVESNLTSSDEKFHISPIDTTMGVLDMEVLASAGVDDVVSKKRKRKPKRLDNVNVGTPKTDVLEEVPVESNLTCSREKLHISPADTTMDVLEKEVSGGVNISVKKRERKSKLKKMNDCSSIERTCLDNVTVKPVSGVTDNVSGVTDNISLSDINNDVMANDHPVATCSVNVNSNGNPLDTTTVLKSRRKLLVLDVNGLLADIVPQCPKRFKPDFTLAKKIVFKRPFCDDFLRFCFEKFDVGIWSSRTKKNLTRAVDLLMNNMKDKLIFCWDGSRCTNTGFKTLEDKHKPLVLKELKNLWESKANHLPSQRRFYDESNTILLDDSPYKALRNPPYTAIHPKAYSYADVKDKSLGPNGDIRLYLERLAEAENVQEFIQANPFGHQSITNAHPSWNFYSKIVRNQAGKRNFNYQRP